MSYGTLDAIADAVNPLLALAAIAAGVLDLHARRVRTALLFFVTTILGVAGIYAIAGLDETYGIWARYRSDYSTHTALATTLVTSLLIWRPGWRAPLAGVWFAYMVLILVMRYHTLGEVIAAMGVGVGVTVPWHMLARRSPK
jgi:hypothetical protein